MKGLSRNRSLSDESAIASLGRADVAKVAAGLADGMSSKLGTLSVDHGFDPNAPELSQ